MVNKTDSQFRIRTHTLLTEGNPIWQDDKKFIMAFNAIEEKTIVSPHRCYTLYQIAQHANAINGSFAQVGIYKGGSAKLISASKNPKKSFYLFDTFEGLPKHDSKIDIYTEGKFADTSLEEVKELFKNDYNVQIHKGLFPTTGVNIPKDEKFAFVYLDVDLYKSNLEALEFFYSRMSTGGVIVFDDYGFNNCPGIEKSVYHFLQKSKANEKPIITTKFQAMLIKA